ncbi:G-protein coupled receptor family C group 6 member A-like [Pimephales promelas]|uniref:G-protein coupled receptor family C group 6 member A-like n=1 Tax=Pimephales promelas TaxID=90988 RepID=UPI001955E472|nr:G-protein coupled receptor family C group 6 member A-like [Pimephales promelas]KAG1935874.1 extracellular calcium-sensing receptor [Pimephales promelas]
MYLQVMYRLSIGILIVAGSGSACENSPGMCGAWADGDIRIGVLNSCHSKVQTLQVRERPEKYNCTELNFLSLVRTLAVVHTIETINNSSFLPGVRLGYYICDTCSDASKAIQSTEHLLAVNGTLPVQCEVLERPNVKAIIGARFSEDSLAVARLLSLYMVPQISTTSSAQTLSDRVRYPAFLRTIPSDIYQTKALANFMKRFHWDWVGVVYGDDDYGKNALQSFLADAEDADICQAFKEALPHYLAHDEIDKRIQEVAETIRSSEAKVVLLILKEELVSKLFKEMIRQNISRTWIASDAWSMSRNISRMDGINGVGDIFGFTFITGPNPGFKEFLQQLTLAPGSVNLFLEEYKQLGKDTDFLTEAVDISTTYGERLAVWSIAYALKRLLNCSETDCPGERDFPPWKLLKELKRVNFTMDSQPFYFNASGNFMNGYDLINWQPQESTGQRRFVVVGYYKLTKKEVDIEAPITWSNPNNTVPVSMCSAICPPGTAKKLLKTACCHNCIQCLEGTYSNETNLPNCLPCEKGTWSLKGWTSCKAKEEDYWKWDGSHAIVLLTFTALGYLLLFCTLIIFLVFCGKPVMNQAGGNVCFVIIAGLALSYTSVILFIGKPNIHICRGRQILYALGFSLTVSCILVKALRTFVSFIPFQLGRVKRSYNPPVIITCSTLIQAIICVFWMIFDSPAVETIESDQSMLIMIQCNEGSGIGFAIMLCYIALLALICFLLAFKGRKVPQRFNETGHIILSMLVYLFVWVCFTPVYIGKINERYSIQAAAILVSCYGIIFCHFAPKWYMALCKKKEEISREAYIAKAKKRIIDSTVCIPEIPEEPCFCTTGSQNTINSIDTGLGSIKLSRKVLHQENDVDNMEFLHQTIRKRPRRKSI